MCAVSNKIKFCTCNVALYEELDNYWLLHRYNKDKPEHIILGDAVIPSEWSDPNFKINNQVLEARLNESDAFDFPIVFKAKDQLEIVFNNKAKDIYDRLIYCFRFKKGKWIIEEYDGFIVYKKYDEHSFGGIKEGIK